MAYGFSHKIGEVLEVRDISTTEVYGGTSANGQTWVSSETTHFNKCRVRWEQGGEEFVNCSGDYSVGDRVAVVWESGRRVTDLNLNTHGYKKVAAQDRGCIKWVVTAVAYVGMIALAVITGLGLGWGVALAFGAMFAVPFFMERMNAQETARLNDALASYLQSIK